MFAKLLKYERKATGPLLGLLSLVCLITAALCGVTTVLSEVSWENTVVEVLVRTAKGLALAIFFISTIAYGLGATLLVLYRFYKNKFTDEGYLTFTLPVKSSQLFLSSLLNLMFWQIICFCVTGISVLLLFWISGYLPDALETFSQVIRGFREVFSHREALTILLISLPTGLIIWFFGCVMAMTCIVLGAAWAKKHKLLLAFALYYGLSCVLQFVLSIAYAVLMLTFLHMEDPVAFVYLLIGATGLFYLLLTMGGYCLSIHMMSRKLRLP